MRWTVLSVAYPLAPVRPDTPGGAEQILQSLDSALTRVGHQSIVVACAGSQTEGILIPSNTPKRILDARAIADAQVNHRKAIDHTLARWKVDLVHMHGVDFDSYMPESEVPVLVTLHLPLPWYNPQALRANRPNTYFNCVSNTQFSTAQTLIPGLVPTIGNGVPVAFSQVPLRKRDFVLALGRVCPEKGFHISLDAAKRAGVPLILAGRVFGYPDHLNYFKQEIVPRLDGLHYKFVGPVGPERKRALLAAARCLLISSRAPETSSLVAMEALACGTPVIAFPSGALPEIVEHGKTGYIVGSEAEMAGAIAATAVIDSNACRAAAVDRFSAELMVSRYFDLYQSILARHPRRERKAANEP